MFIEREEAIRSRAHALWLDEGRPDGRALEHWLAAQREQTAAGVVQPWCEPEATAAGWADWMRQALWAPQPYAVTG